MLPMESAYIGLTTVRDESEIWIFAFFWFSLKIKNLNFGLLRFLQTF